MTAPPKSMEFCGTDFGCIFHTCRILGCAKCSPVRESTKCRFRPRRHSTANVSSAARVFGSRTVVRSNPSVCVWLAAQRMTIKSDKQTRTEQTNSKRSSMKSSWRRRMSAIGTKRTWPSALHMSAFEGKADMAIAPRNVRLFESRCRP